MNLPSLGLPTAPVAPAPAAPVNYFSGSNGMDASAKLPFFPAGFLGRVAVDQTKGITQRDGSRAFIAELTVLESNMADRVFVGGRYSWFQSLKEPGTAYPACISFLYAALGLDAAKHKAAIDSQIKPNQDAWLNSCSNANPLKGAEIRLQTTNKKTKAGGDFTLHAFSPTPEGIAKADAAFAAK